MASKKYDVFISFRGEDTRTNFISHLYEAFCRNQIETYIDYRLNRGDEISSALMQAIEDSYVSVVIFSENYASSKWCLDELIKILQCKRDQAQVVIPVFYKIDPSHVRHHTGPYKQAFEKHERDLIIHNNKHIKNKIHKWKHALTQAASLAGWDPSSFRDESKLIQKIVKDVLQKLDCKYPTTELRGLVGIDDNCSQIALLLRKVKTIGIWGMGGIGKKTIAQSLFVKYSSQYEGCCFLENVRENSAKHENGLVGLRSKLLQELLKEKDLKSNFVEHRLNRIRVFVVLDDVSTSKELKYLTGDLRCFGPGSRIIITTRDKHVLSKGVDVIYKVKELNFQESFRLFNLNAFNQSLPDHHENIGYEELSKKVVVYAKGVPLALKVLGAFLRGKTETEWDSTLRKLEKIPDEEIYGVLKISYDGLNHEEQEIFLDIACFLKGKKKEHVISLLDSFGFFGTIGIRTLQDKALITIDDRMLVCMHDLIQEMGWEIVRRECIKESGKHSRLWDSEEVYDVLANNKGSDAIEGIMADVSKIRNVHLSADTFKKMSNLRFLNFHSTFGNNTCNVHLPKGLESFPNKIRYLEWYGYPLKSLPSMFQPEMLIELHLTRSHVKKLWNGVQDLINLKLIDLSHSKQLMELPDFSKASNLERVYLNFCIHLRNIHPSILSLQSLSTLYLQRCKKLERLKSETDHLRSLTFLNVDGCSNLKELSVSSTKIRYLGLRFTRIEILHFSTTRGPSSQLKWLDLNGSRLEKFPEQLSRFQSLTRLGLFNCEIIDNQRLQVLFDGLWCLKEVTLDDCCNITELPNNIKHVSGLQVLNLINCKSLWYIPKLPESIVELNASNCTSLKTIFKLETCTEATENRKFMSFQNCFKLDEQSLHSIMEDAYSSMMQAAYGNVLMRRRAPNQVNTWKSRSEVCVPGSEVPEWFSYRTKQASISFELPLPSHLLGFIFCVVIDHLAINKAYGHSNTILCRSSSLRGHFHDIASTLMYFPSTLEMDSDHVHLWYNAWDCHEILRTKKTTMASNNLKVSFKFIYDKKIINNLCVDDWQYGFTGIKECGVCPIYVSAYEDFISELKCGRKRPRDVDELESEQELVLQQLKKLKLDLGCDVDLDELEALLMRMQI